MVSSVFGSYGILDYVTSAIDIIVVAFILYKLFCLIQGTRAVQLIKGIAIILIAAVISNILHLHTIQWILSQLWAVLFILLVVVFQPELRKALERIGMSGQLWTKSFFSADIQATDSMINAVVRAVVSGSKTKTGMLIALERSVGLNDYIETGIGLDAMVSEQLLGNIFVPNTPLHDGAVVIRKNRIVAVACFLPLSDNPYISSSLGTRHRAAIGLSEVSDALIIVVSEETGTISVAKDGKLARGIEEKELRSLLQENAASTADNAKASPFRRFGKHEK